MDLVIKMFSDVKPEAWIGLLGVAVGAVLSIVGVLLTSYFNSKNLKIQLSHQAQEKSRSIKRERLEELYILTENWLSAFSSSYLSLSLVMKGEIDYNQHLDLFIADRKNNSHEFYRLQMIIDIYGGGLQGELEKIIKLRDVVNKIAFLHKNEYKAGNLDGTKFLQPYTDANLKLLDEGDSFKGKIAKMAKELS